MNIVLSLFIWRESEMSPMNKGTISEIVKHNIAIRSVDTENKSNVKFLGSTP